MPAKLFLHLVCLLLLFVFLNGVVKWVIIPEIQSSQTAAQKKTQEDLGKVLMDMPMLGDYIDKLQKKLDNKSELALDKKNQPYAVEQQFKDQFLYFLQKQILLSSQELIKKEPEAQEKTAFVQPAKKPLDFLPAEIDKTKINKQEPPTSYFSELSQQLTVSQIDNILNAFQDHLKKLKPTLNKLEIEILQYDKVIPDAVLENNNYLTDFHYKLKEEKEIHLAFLSTSNLASNLLPSLDAVHGIKSFYQINIKEQKVISLLRQLPAPVIELKTVKMHFSDEKGQRRLAYSDSADLFQLWHWQENGNLTVLELFWPPNKSSFNENVLYDYVLLFFMLLLGTWFYFYHDSLSKEKDLIGLPSEIANLKKEKKQLENLLIDTMENKHKEEKPKEKPKEITKKAKEASILPDTQPKSYLIPKEQTYLDSKIDFKKESRDILMEEAKTELLKSLVKKIREE